MKAWLSNHGRVFNHALRRLWRTPLTSLLNLTIIGMTLALPAGGYLILENLRILSGNLAATPEISVFLALDANAASIADIEKRLKQHPAVQEAKFVARDKALDQLKKTEGMGDLIAGLPQNPLPDAFIITAKTQDPATLERLGNEIKTWPKVAQVQLDSAWIKRLDALLKLGRVTVSILAILLSFALIAVTFGAVRSEVLIRREEIEVSQLIGATDSFIRRPFLYAGALQGLFGALFGLIIIYAGILLLNRPLLELSGLYGTNFQLRFLGVADMFWILSFAALLGWLGAWISVSRALGNLHHASQHATPVNP